MIWIYLGLGLLVFFSLVKFMLRADGQLSSKPLPRAASLQEIEDLLAQGYKLEAIKAYRQLKGVGLKEAKEAVESLARGVQPEAALPQNHAQPELRELIRSGQKIQAIKLYRELHGVGLKEAKDAVEELERNL